MENLIVSGRGAQTVSGETNGQDSSAAEKAAEKARIAALRANAEIMKLVTLLSALPSEEWSFVKSEVSANRRDATDESTPAGRKLFGPGIHAKVSRVGLEFKADSGFKPGLYDVESRETAKGREGKVTMTLRNIADDSTITLNSRDHSGIVTDCMPRRAPNKSK
jgi:hypothetical protein